jgi:PIN domain nuclease of toxin-antitoxin system
MSDLLLDTCVLIWLTNDRTLSSDAQQALDRHLPGASPISVWEVANLARKKRLFFDKSPADWFREICFRIKAVPTALDIEILANSCALPGKPPNDPADRIIIATARESDMTIVTRDHLILDYARAGHVRAMAC